MAVDPCREWLGIEAVELADPCRVLGLTPGRHQAATIEKAAAARLEALRLVSPGPFAKAHAALLARVESARLELLADSLPTFIAERVPGRHEAPAAPDQGGPGDAGQAAAWRHAVPPPAHPHGPPVAGRHVGAASFGGPAAAVIALLLAVAAVLAALVPALVLLRQGEGSGRTVAVRPEDRPAGGSAPVPIRPADAGRVAPGDRTASERRRRDRPPVDAGGPTDRAPSVAVPPTRTEGSPPDERADGGRDLAAVNASLTEAYAALRRQDFAAADGALARAAERVGDDVEANTRLERWRLLATYAREFVGYRERAFAAANAGREYDVDGTRVSVIEVNPRLFIYKKAGRIERVPRDAVDPGLEMAIVATWFAGDGRAANHLFLGARWLCLDRPDSRRARAEWQAAGTGGESVAPLLALLDDPVIRPAGR